MTAVEWLEKICKDRGYHLMEDYFEQAKQMEKREMILLLNWVLKRYDTHVDSNHMFCWKSPSGKELNSVDLVEQYIKETYGEE